jgi:hypothetical protein
MAQLGVSRIYYWQMVDREMKCLLVEDLQEL